MVKLNAIVKTKREIQNVHTINTTQDKKSHDNPP